MGVEGWGGGVMGVEGWEGEGDECGWMGRRG